MYKDKLVDALRQYLYGAMWKHPVPIQGIVNIPLKLTSKRAGSVRIVDTTEWYLNHLGHDIPFDSNTLPTTVHKFYVYRVDSDYLVGVNLNIPTNALTRISNATIPDLANTTIVTKDGFTLSSNDIYALLSGNPSDGYADHLLICIPSNVLDRYHAVDHKLNLTVHYNTPSMYTRWVNVSLYKSNTDFSSPILYNGSFYASDVSNLITGTSAVTEINTDNVTEFTFSIKSLPRFMDKKRQIHYLIHLPKDWAYNKMVNSKLCQFYIVGANKIGKSLASVIKDLNLSVTHQDFSIPKVVIDTFINKLDSTGPYTLHVLVPEQAVGKPLIDEVNLLKTLYTNTDSEIINYLVTDIRNNEYSFWSAEHLYESQFSRLLEATTPLAVNKFLTVVDYSKLLGPQFVNHILFNPMITLVTPATTFYAPLSLENTLELRVHDEMGAYIDSADYTYTTEYNKVTLDYSGLGLADGTPLYIECLPSGPTPITLVPPGGNRLIERVAEDYILLQWKAADGYYASWVDVTANIVKDNILEHVSYNNLGYLKFNIDYDDQTFVVVFGHGQSKINIQLVENTTRYDLKVIPNRFYCNLDWFWRVTYSNVLPVYRGIYEKVEKIYSGESLIGIDTIANADILDSEEPHPSCMATKGVNFTHNQCLRYTPSASLINSNYALHALEISYAPQYDYDYGADNTFAVEASLKNLTITKSNLSDGIKNTSTGLNSFYKKHMVTTVKTKGRSFTINWDEYPDKTFVLLVAPSDYESNGSIVLDFEVADGDIKRLAKVQAVYRNTVIAGLADKLNDLTFPVNDAYAVIYVNDKRLMQDIDYKLESDTTVEGKLKNQLVIQNTSLIEGVVSELNVSIMHKAYKATVVTDAPIFDEEEPSYIPQEITGVTTVVSHPDALYPVNNLFTSNANTTFRCLDPINPSWFEFIYDHDENIGCIYLEPSADAVSLKAPMEDFYIELYDNKNRMIAVNHVNNRVVNGIFVEAFYVPDVNGNPTTRYFDNLKACKIKFNKRTPTLYSRGFALNRVIVYDTNNAVDMKDPLLRDLGTRIVHNRFLPPTIDYVSFMASKGFTETIEYGDEVVIHGYDPLTYNSLEADVTEGGVDNLRVLATTTIT